LKVEGFAITSPYIALPWCKVSFMVSAFSQVSRMGRLTTALGPDVLVLQRFGGTERMNGLFDWQVDCLAATAEIDFDALIGTHASVTLQYLRDARVFDGIVTEARWLGAGENGHRFTLRLQPWFWLASLRRNQRIFHNRTVIQILDELLCAYSDAGQLEVATVDTYPVLEYTVQFRESDMDFATRLMERHGISYHFRHAEGAHKMVLTDAVDSHATIGVRDFHPDDGHHQAEDEHFWAWQPARRMTTGAIRLTDYNFKLPNAKMEVDRIGDATHAQGKIESFDWPGDYLDQNRGRLVAKLRSDAERGQDQRFAAEGDVLSLGAGMRVGLAGDAVPGLGMGYLCLVANHSFTSESYGTGGQTGDDLPYRGHYVLIPETSPMRPERKTALADVRGPQTAVVVGEGEIDCDEYGRILVRFHWDLKAANSMRCRVSQNWGGNGWGGMVIPRIGMEVVVEFLDGDPDQPLVTGCVYNGRNKVPYDLPTHKTRSTFKTDTHKGNGFNELRFEDEKAKEEIFIHGQRDLNIKIERNASERVNRNAVISVGHDQATEIGNTMRQMVGGDLHIGVGPGKLGTITPSGADENTQGIGFVAEALGDVGSKLGSGNLVIGVEDTKSQMIAMNHTESVGRDKSTEVRGNYTLDAGKKIEITAGDSITLKVGASLITMQDNGTITVNGKKLSVTMNKLIELFADLVKIN
jgi:type VI secretion system secreted protein VgrG